MHPRLLAVLSALGGLAALTFGGAAQAGGLPAVSYRLDNGLRVILHQDRRVPLVQVHVRYHVGARHEEAGRTGLAHLFEHLMFRGSRNLKDPFDYLHDVGATGMNGTTSFDSTDYYETMPRANLAVALWAESDRMGFLPDVFEGRGDLLKDERKVVKNERRMRVDTVPYRAATERQWQVLFPKTHPYHGMVIGSMSDLDAATLPELKAFFRRYYSPSNATLVVAGDFDVAQAQTLVRKYFATLPSTPRPAPPQAPPVSLDQQVVLRHEEHVGLARRLLLAWHSPAAFEPGDHALDVLAEILADSRSGRLTRRLEDAGLSFHARAWQESLALQSVFHIEAQLTPPADEAQVLAAVDAVLDEIRRDGVRPEELVQARARLKTTILSRLAGIAGKAGLLQRYAEHLGDPDRIAEDLRAYDEISAEEVQRLMRAVLRPDRRVVLWAVPKGSGAGAGGGGK